MIWYDMRILCINKIWFFQEAVFHIISPLCFFAGLTGDIFGPYVGDAGFDPAGFAKNQRLLPWCPETVWDPEILRSQQNPQILRFLSKKMDFQDHPTKISQNQGVFTIFSFEGFVVCWKGPVS